MPPAFIAVRDRGRQRASNQDFAIATTLAPGRVLLAVADGVGGARGGEVASAEAVGALREALEGPVTAAPWVRLQAALEAANRRVRTLAASDPNLEGMASTLVVALAENNDAWIANLGDSRAYRCRGDGIELLTEDDSWVAEQVRAGLLTEREAERSPYRNAITRGIGVTEALEARDAIHITVGPGETLLLCSDGLYRTVPPDAIAGALRDRPLEEGAARLIALANEAGGPDNIAVALFRPDGG